MNRPGCGHENRAGRKFCAECGVALENLYRSCDARNEPGEKFYGDLDDYVDEPLI